jgi:hypothetical protein
MAGKKQAPGAGRGQAWPVERGAALWRQGLPVREIARQIGCTTRQAHDRITYYQSRRPDLYPPRRRGQPADHYRERLARGHATQDAQRQAQAAAIHISPDDARWLGATLDAIGTIAVDPREVCLRVHSVRRALIEWIALATGYGETRQLHRRAHVDHVWEVRYAPAVCSILRQVAPYMRVRRRLAECVCRWPHVARGELITPEIASARRAIYDEAQYYLASEDLPPGQEA